GGGGGGGGRGGGGGGGGRRRRPPKRVRLAGPVHHRAGQPPGQLARGDLQRVGGGVVQPEIGGQPVGDLGEAAADDPAAVAEPAQGADQRPGAGREPQIPPDLLQHRGVQARQQGDPPGP